MQESTQARRKRQNEWSFDRYVAITAILISTISVWVTSAIYNDGKREAAIASTPISIFQISGNSWSIQLRNLGKIPSHVHHVDFVFEDGQVVPIFGTYAPRDTIVLFRQSIEEAIRRQSELEGNPEFLEDFKVSMSRTAAPIRILAPEETTEIYGFDTAFADKWRDSLNATLIGISLRACSMDVTGRHILETVEGGQKPAAACPTAEPILKM